MPGEVALPEDFSLSVRYQGSVHEEFTVADPYPQNLDVCCRLATPVQGALPQVRCGQSFVLDAAVPTAVVCELWTGDLPEVTVTASGYPDLVETLKGRQRADGCGLKTSDVRLEVAAPDGGA